MNVEKDPLSEKQAQLNSNDDLRKIELELSRGLQFANLIGSLHQEKLDEMTCLLNALVELLIGKGVVHVHELEQRKKEVATSYHESSAEQPAVQLIETPDKYETEHEISLDCANRVSVCKALCCRLWFSLSVQDLSEGIVRWNYGMPYGIAQENGTCVHLDRTHLHCNIYPHRPLVCRSFDCRGDARIWKDYDQKILNPETAAQHFSLNTDQ